MAKLREIGALRKLAKNDWETDREKRRRWGLLVNSGDRDLKAWSLRSDRLAGLEDADREKRTPGLSQRFAPKSSEMFLPGIPPTGEKSFSSFSACAAKTRAQKNNSICQTFGLKPLKTAACLFGTRRQSRIDKNIALML